MLISFAAPVFADGTDAAEVSGAADDSADLPSEAGIYTLDGKTWDELMEEFSLKYNCGPRTIAAGYCNTVTGEEHFFR